MHENKFNSYRVPSGLLILFLEKALTLIHMETHLTDVSIFHFIFSLLIHENIILTHIFLLLIEWGAKNMQSTVFPINSSQLWCFGWADREPINWIRNGPNFESRYRLIKPFDQCPSR